MPRRRTTRTRRPSTTSSGARRSSPSVSAANLLLKLGKVLELVGEWQRAEAGRARRRTRRPRALADDSLSARGARRRSARSPASRAGYDEALGLLVPAAARFEAARGRRGLGQVPHLAGTLAAQRGDYEHGGRALRGEPRDPRAPRRPRRAWAALLSNLGVVAEYVATTTPPGSTTSGPSRCAQSSATAGDRRLPDEPRDDRRAPPRLRGGSRAVRRGDAAEPEVGDAWMVAISHNNLGNAAARPRRPRRGPRELRREPARLPRLRRQVGAGVSPRGHRAARRAARPEPRGPWSSSARRTGSATRSARRDHPGWRSSSRRSSRGGADRSTRGAYEASSRTRARGETSTAAALRPARTACLRETPD